MRKPETQAEPAPATVPASGTAAPWFPVWLLALLLAMGTVTLYWPATRHEFINYDDDVYVTANLHVQQGLTLDNLKWAFVNPVCFMWNPLTVLSHMLDCQMYGLKPWGHHLTSVLLHALNTVLVFLFLRSLTGALWRSALVAALFGWHPMHVESVAWVAERKDVLSSFWGLLTLIFYGRYAQRRLSVERREPSATLARAPSLRPWRLDYWLALLFFALGLMSKPMLVTWPFVLLLLDYWPLGRFDLSTPNSKLATIGRLVREKVPFFALAALSSVVAYVVQKQSGALAAGGNLPLELRVGNVLISYCRYLEKLFCPVDLAVFYPYPAHWPRGEVLLAGGLILGITALLFAKWRQYPFMLMGWLWFVGTLVPVIQLVQTWGHAMADRYSYLPSVGLFILVIWGAYELTRSRRNQSMALFVAGSAALVVGLGLTRQQLGYWSDSETLFRHALAVTDNNYLAHYQLGSALDSEGELDQAIGQYREAIRLKPDLPEAYYNLGSALGREGELDEAIGQYREAIRLKPNFPDARNNLGSALGMQGQFNEAITQLQEAIRLRPNFAEACYNLGISLEKNGELDAAIRNYREAIRLRPNFAEAYYHLGIALDIKGRFEEAIENYRQAIQINPNRPEVFVHLGATLCLLGRTREAAAQYQEALGLNPNLVVALNDLAWILAASPDDELRNGAEAVRLAERACELTHFGQPMLVGTLAAAYAESGSFPEAITTAEKAEQLAVAAGQPAVAAKNRQLLELYRAGKPYHEPAPTGH